MKKLLCTILLGTALVGGNALAATDVAVPASGGMGTPVASTSAAEENPFPKEGALASVPYFDYYCVQSLDKTVSADVRAEAERLCQSQSSSNPYTAYIFDKSGNLIQKRRMREGATYGFNIAPGMPKTPLRLDGHLKEGTKEGWSLSMPLSSVIQTLNKH